MAEDDDSDVILGDDAMAHGSLRTQVAVLNAKVKLVGYLLRHDYVTRYEFGLLQSSSAQCWRRCWR